MSLCPGEVDFDGIWSRIKYTIERVLAWQPFPKKEWNDNFSDVYVICVSNQESLDERLYRYTKNFFENHTRDIHKRICLQNESLQNLLNEYYTHWTKYQTGSKHINSLFKYLNEHYALRKKHDYMEHIQLQATENETMEIGQMALEMWKAEVIKPLQTNLIKGLLAEVTRDRKGERPPETIVRGIISSLIDVQAYDTKNPLKLYQTTFEEKMLEEEAEFYENEANRLWETCNCSQYMQKVDIRLAEENLRARRFFDPTSYDKVTAVAQSKLVQAHQSALTSECKQMVQAMKTTDLTRMYTLLKPIHTGFQALLSEFEEHISNTGLGRVKSLHNENEMAQFVHVLLELHKEYTDIIENVFSSDQAFFGSRDKACTKIVNHRFDQRRACMSPELLAKYCDSLLKKNTKNFTESEVEEKLNNVITIFKYLDDKDVFQKFYSKLLAKRLIHSLSASMDMEEGMITKLKLACGYEYTNKLHRMFTDMTISTDLNQKFTNFVNDKSINLGINFSLLVLQSGAWPLGQSTVATVNLPNELCKSVSTFEAFYNNMFNGRKLTWLQHLSNGEMKLTYLKKPYIVTCTTYQMAILLLFNGTDTMTYREIDSHLQLEVKELKRTLQSVLDVKLLTKQPSEEKDLTVCTFNLNKDFSNKRTKFKITAAVQRETPQEVEQTHTSVDEDRKMYTQAAIVRIMKSRKVMKHNLLIQEVVDQSRARFSPSTQLIKKCVEALIEKNYIERVKGARDEYSYVA
ncbi:cullin-2-like [Clytia hemisphaerica]|uniref:Cullin-2 n=1 Tax=Clytia hemisphaerica TaxID=252671 RepID=A0A7M5V2M5_9CNID|eukprot:TCONS_00045584-protein